MYPTSFSSFHFFPDPIPFFWVILPILLPRLLLLCYLCSITTLSSSPFLLPLPRPCGSTGPFLSFLFNPSLPFPPLPRLGLLQLILPPYSLLLDHVGFQGDSLVIPPLPQPCVVATCPPYLTSSSPPSHPIPTCLEHHAFPVKEIYFLVLLSEYLIPQAVLLKLQKF